MRGKGLLINGDYDVQFVCDDVLTYESGIKYDFVISQAVLRHMIIHIYFLIR